MLELLTSQEMGMADRAAISRGISGIELMENAGRAVLDCLDQVFPQSGRVLVVCGGGNNAGDGFVLARLLAERGQPVQLFLLVDPDTLRGDAKMAYERLTPQIVSRSQPEFTAFDLVVDAIFGAGLDRPVEGHFADAIDAINGSGKPVLAIDLPSGIEGSGGTVMGKAVKANASITFFRLKPGHLLLPGRTHCGNVHLAQIGIPQDVLEDLPGVRITRNCEALWQQHFPYPKADSHKYHRGHVLVMSGPFAATGAARLAAGAALRAGAGLVTMASPKEAMAENAAHLTAVMLREVGSASELQAIVGDPRFNCVALGPGMKPDRETRQKVLAAHSTDRKTVLDAGAISAFEDVPFELFDAIRKNAEETVLTPHAGEFSKLFSGEIRAGSKVDQARAAAEMSGATVILKGADTVVASPDGRASISDRAPPWLATAGSGDVLTGIVAGLLAQGMPAYEASNAAVWLHSDAANRIGPGMISSDLDHGLHAAIRDIMSGPPLRADLKSD